MACPGALVSALDFFERNHVMQPAASSCSKARGSKRLERVGLHHHRKCTVERSLVAWGNATSQRSWVRMDKIGCDMHFFPCKSSVKIKSLPDLRKISNAGE